MTVANFISRGLSDIDVGSGIWFDQLLAKKFHVSWPSTENMATKLAESTLLLKNLRPKPGMMFLYSESGGAAVESLIIP